jgi:hypothetical protein
MANKLGFGVKVQSEQVENWEKENPNQIHEMPEQAGDFDSVGKLIRMGLPHLASRAPEISDH